MEKIENFKVEDYTEDELYDFLKIIHTDYTISMFCFIKFGFYPSQILLALLNMKKTKI